MRGQTKLTGTLGATLRALRRSRPTRRIVSNESLTPLHFEIHKQQKLFVADIGYKEPEWQLVFSKDTGFTDQKIRFVADEEELTSVIESDDLSGFYITNVAYGDGRWVVVFHKGASYVEQQIM